MVVVVVVAVVVVGQGMLALPGYDEFMPRNMPKLVIVQYLTTYISGIRPYSPAAGDVL